MRNRVKVLIYGVLSMGLVLQLRSARLGEERAPASIPSYSALQNQILALIPVLPKDSLKVTADKLVPRNLEPNEDAGTVARKFVDRGLIVLFSSEGFKSSKLGHVSESVKENLKADVSIHSNNDRVEHRFKGEILALQSQAKVNYTGYFNADLTLDPLHQAYNVKLKEDFLHKDFYYQHEVTPVQLYNEVGVTWTW